MSPPEDANPYQAPTGLFSTWQPTYFSSRAEDGVTPKIVEMLAKTQPWVRFLSVLAFIAFGVALLGVVALLILGVAAGSVENLVMAAMSAIFSVVYLAPAILLSRYASDIARLRETLRVQDLEDALRSQKSFWKFAGIVTLVMIVVYAFLAIIVVASGVAFLEPSSGPVKVRGSLE